MAGAQRVWTINQKLTLVAEMELCDSAAAFAGVQEISSALRSTLCGELHSTAEAAKLQPRSEPMFVPVVSEPSSLTSHGVVLEIGGAAVGIGQTARTDLLVSIIQAPQMSSGE